MIEVRDRWLTASAVLAAALASPACAQASPEVDCSAVPSDLRVVVPFAPGGIDDALARELATRLKDRCNIAVQLDHVTGDDGRKGVLAVLERRTAARTLVTIGASEAVLAEFGIPPDDLLRLRPVAMLGAAPMVVVAAASSELTDLRSAVAALQSGGVRAAYRRPGSLSHLAVRLFGTACRCRIPAESRPDLRIDDLDGKTVLFVTIGEALRPLRDGKVKVIAVLGDRRHPLLTDVPTLVEQGFPLVKVDAWVGLAANPGMSADQALRIAGAAHALLAEPPAPERVVARGFVLEPGGPTVLTAHLNAEIARAASVAASAPSADLPVAAAMPTDAGSRPTTDHGGTRTPPANRIGSVLNLGMLSGGAREGAQARSRMGSLRGGMSCAETERTLGITLPIGCDRLEAVGDVTLRFNGIELQFEKGARLVAWQ